MKAVEQDKAPDRLAGCLHPRENGLLLGHDAAQELFLEAAGRGRLHHAWLLFGKEGVGKATLAYRMAAFVLSGGVERLSSGASEQLVLDENSHAARLVRNASHPNLLALKRSWNDKTKKYSAFITVENVRELQHFLGSTAGMGRWRVVIIDRADDMNVNAANALLKMLEEPPEYCLFLLVSSKPGVLPTTIRSRCQKLRLEPLAMGELQQAVQHVAGESELSLPQGDEFSSLLELAEGSVRLALELSVGETLKLYREVEAMLDLLPRVDPQKTVELAQRLGGRNSEQDYETFFHLLSSLLAKRVKQMALAQRGSKSALAHWAELWETISKTRNDVDRLNLDRENFIIDLFARIEAVAATNGGLQAHGGQRT